SVQCRLGFGGIVQSRGCTSRLSLSCTHVLNFHSSCRTLITNKKYSPCTLLNRMG
uniref:Ovule protein n=1 Tax=Mesocestoides corti TaxID=53468 RepID=A0A5K3FFL6_MESCO